MESPFKSWCYQCNAYHNPDIYYKWAQAPRDRSKKKQIVLQYKALCPLCGGIMYPDNKIVMFVRFIEAMIHKQTFNEYME